MLMVFEFGFNNIRPSVESLLLFWRSAVLYFMAAWKKRKSS